VLTDSSQGDKSPSSDGPQSLGFVTLSNFVIKRGDVLLVDFEPTLEGEANKVRPAVVMSNNANNNFAPTITVLPLSTNTRRLYPFQVLLEASLTGLDNDSKAQAEQVRTMSKKRIKGFVKSLPEEMVGKLEQALKLHLAV
jgi:mRNA interferase MazF